MTNTCKSESDYTVACGPGSDTLPNQTESAAGPSHLETSAERDSKSRFIPNRQITRGR
jgi:hypothetical protein